jgi:hypothetical protein
MSEFSPLPNSNDKQTPNGIFWSANDIAQVYGGKGILCPNKLKENMAMDLRVDLTQLPAATKKQIEDKLATPTPVASTATATTATMTAATTTGPAGTATMVLPSTSSTVSDPMAMSTVATPIATPVTGMVPTNDLTKMGGANSFDAFAAALFQVNISSNLRIFQVSSTGPTDQTASASVATPAPAPEPAAPVVSTASATISAPAALQTGGKSRRRRRRCAKRHTRRHRRY